MTPKQTFEQAQELSIKLEKLLLERKKLNEQKRQIHKRLYNIPAQIEELQNELIEMLR